VGGKTFSIFEHERRLPSLIVEGEGPKVNGFGNRNLWLCVQRSKFLPDGGDWDHLDLEPLIGRLKDVVEFARGVGEMRRNVEALGRSRKRRFLKIANNIKGGGKIDHKTPDKWRFVAVQK
jgi:hypothetical protein